MNASMARLAASAIGLTAAALMTAGCSATTPRMDTTGETWEGLVPVRDSGMKEAWIKPDIDLTRYTRIRIEPTELQFRATRPGAGRMGPAGGSTEFPVDEADRKRLQETVTEIFTEELARSTHFELANDDGPHVLRVETSLLDIVSKVPPERPMRSEIYIDEVGAATLVLELRDSESGEILARAVDRRSADPVDTPGGMPGITSRANAVTAWTEVRRVARRWATTVRLRLDQLYERGRMPSGLTR